MRKTFFSICSLFTATLSLLGENEVIAPSAPVVVNPSTNSVYDAAFAGDGNNEIIFSGSRTKTINVSDGVQNFTSLSVIDGTVVYSLKTGTFLWNDDINMRCANLAYRVKNGSAELGKNGNIIYGHDSNIEVNSSKTATTLHLGKLVRSPEGGTLLLRSQSSKDTDIGEFDKFFATGYQDGELLPATIVGGMQPASGSNASWNFLQYDEEKGIIPATTVPAFSETATAADIAKITSATEMVADAHVRGFVADGYFPTLTIPEGITLKIGDGVNPAGIIFHFMRNNDNYSSAPVLAGNGSIDFGTSEGIIWAPPYQTAHSHTFGNVKIKGSNGVTFSGRGNGVWWSSIWYPTTNTWSWTGKTTIESCVIILNENAKTVHDDDWHIVGNSNYGASLMLYNNNGKWVFNGKMTLEGPGFLGMDNTYNNVNAVYSTIRFRNSGVVKLNGEIEIRKNVQLTSEHTNSGATFNNTVSGDGSLYFSHRGAYTFNVANTYAGKTVVGPSSTLTVNQSGTLGKGDVEIKEAGTLQFKDKTATATDNVITGAGKVAVVNSQLAIAKEFSVGTLSVDATSRVEIHGTVEVNSLQMSDGAVICAPDGEEATLILGSNNGNSTINHGLSDGGGKLHIVKKGTGKITVSDSIPTSFNSLKVESGSIAFAVANPASDSYTSWMLDASANGVIFTDDNGAVTNWVASNNSGIKFIPDRRYSGLGNPTTGLNKINGLNTVTFSRAAKSRMCYTSKPNHTTMFFVMRPSKNINGTMELFGQRDYDSGYGLKTDGTGQYWSFGSNANNDWVYTDKHYYINGTRISDAASAKEAFNAETQLLTTQNSYSSPGWHNFQPAIGGYSKTTGNSFDGDIGEIIACNKLLNENERKLIENYLAKKWLGRTLHNFNYLSDEIEITIDQGASFDIAGESIKLTNVSGSGMITNSNRSVAGTVVLSDGANTSLDMVGGINLKSEGSANYTGTITIEVNADGTIKPMMIEGNISIENARLKIVGLENLKPGGHDVVIAQYEFAKNPFAQTNLSAQWEVSARGNVLRIVPHGNFIFLR